MHDTLRGYDDMSLIISYYYYLNCVLKFTKFSRQIVLCTSEETTVTGKTDFNWNYFSNTIIYHHFQMKNND